VVRKKRREKVRLKGLSNGRTKKPREKTRAIELNGGKKRNRKRIKKMWGSRSGRRMGLKKKKAHLTEKEKTFARWLEERGMREHRSKTVEGKKAFE